MKHVFRLVVLSLIAVASFAAAQPNNQTNVQVKLRGVLRIDVNATDVVFDFTDAAALAQNSQGRDIAGELALGDFWDNATGPEIFAPTFMYDGTGAALADDFALATVTAGGNAQWTLNASLGANFADVPNTLKITTEAGTRQKSTATYTYHADVPMTDADVEIAKAAVGSTPAGANGITDINLFFGYELDLATVSGLIAPLDPNNPADILDETQTITYSLTNP